MSPSLPMMSVGVLFSSVLLPIDFSPESERAVDLAARFAAHGSAVTVLHVLPATPLDIGRVLQQRERAAAARTTAAADQLGIVNAAQASEAPARTLFVGPFRGEAVRDFSSAGQEWGARLDEWAGRVAALGARVRTMLRVGDPADHIVAAAAEADCIILAPHDDHAMRSTARAVLRAARCPVIVVPTRR